MKDLWKSGVIILLIIGALYIIFLRECKRPLPCPAQDELIIKKTTWDSIIAVANKPPVVKIDTVWMKGDVVYIYPDPPISTPVINPQDTTIKHYSDTLRKDDIHAWVTFSIRGQLLKRTWAYTPIIKEIRRDSIIYVPNIVEVEKFVTVPKNSLYGNILFGGNNEAFLFGGGIDLITKKETQIGYQYQRYGDINFHSVKLGFRLFSRTAK